MDAFLYDCISRVRAAGYHVIDSKRMRDLRIRATAPDAALIYEKADTRAIVQRTLITRLTADLIDRPDVLSWRYSQDANVGQITIDATLLVIEPRWKTRDPQP